MLEYIAWLALFTWLPITILWLKFYKNLLICKKVFGYTIIGSLIVGGIWDYVAIRDGVWYFPEDKILNIWILGLPLEEWFFISFFTFLISTITVILRIYVVKPNRS